MLLHNMSMYIGPFYSFPLPWAAFQLLLRGFVLDGQLVIKTSHGFVSSTLMKTTHISLLGEFLERRCCLWRALLYLVVMMIVKWAICLENFSNLKIDILHH